MTRCRDMKVTAQFLKLSKAEASSRQVEEAIKALEGGNFDIAVTLAGAAEGMLKRSGPHMWSHMLQSPQASAFKKNEIISFVNAQRDWLKHTSGGDTMTFARVHAALMIRRAMSKHEIWTPRMKRFARWFGGNLDEVLQELEAVNSSHPLCRRG
jgi:hypothetical protein